MFVSGNVRSAAHERKGWKCVVGLEVKELVRSWYMYAVPSLGTAPQQPNRIKDVTARIAPSPFAPSQHQRSTPPKTRGIPAYIAEYSHLDIVNKMRFG